MSLLPSRGPDTSTSQEGELQVVGVDDDVAPLLDALNSETARAILNEIYSEPGTPSEVADRLDMSIQKVSYHIEKLEDQDLIDVAGTQYSEKGQEMTVYQPPDEPTVLFVGTEERKRSLTTMVKRLLPVVAVVALGSLVIERLFGGGLSFFSMGAQSAREPAVDGGSGGDAGSGDIAAESTNATATETATEAATETPTPTATESGGQIGIAEATETPTAKPQPTATETSTPMATETATPTEVATEAPEYQSGGTETVVAEATEIAYQTTQATASGAGIQLSPGLAFFLGGMTVVVLFAVWWTYSTYA